MLTYIICKWTSAIIKTTTIISKNIRRQLEVKIRDFMFSENKVNFADWEIVNKWSICYNNIIDLFLNSACRIQLESYINKMMFETKNTTKSFSL